MKFLSKLIHGAINGISKEELLSASFWKGETLDNTITEIISGSYKTKEPPEIYGSGYVVKTLEAVLWAFYHTNDFESGALKVVNLGDDADTTGAVFGQIAGAFYGMSGIPEKWLIKLFMKKEIEQRVDDLYRLSQK